MSNPAENWPFSHDLDPRIRPLAHWLFEQVRDRYCENCPPDPIPPLYVDLAKAIIENQISFNTEFTDA